MKILGNSLKEARTVAQQQLGTTPIGKILETAGAKARLFAKAIPGQQDVIAAPAAGRNLNRDALGSSFILLDDYEETPTGKIVDKTILPVLARISKVMHNAEYKRKVRAAEDDARKIAEESGMPVDHVALGEKKKELELQYLGGKIGDEYKAPTENPLVSSSVNVNIAFEVYVVPLKDGDEPLWDKARLGSFNLSKTAMDEIISIAENIKYYNNEDPYLELQYTKPAKGGKHKFEGVSADSKLSVIKPDAFEANKQKILDALPKNAQDTANRNGTFSYSKDADTILVEFKKHVSRSRATLINIDFEAKETKVAAKDFLEYGLLEGTGKILEQMKALIEVEQTEEEKAEIQKAAEETAVVSEAAAKVAEGGVETLKELQAAGVSEDDVAGEIPGIDG